MKYYYHEEEVRDELKREQEKLIAALLRKER